MYHVYHIISQCIMCVILYHNVSCVSYYITMCHVCHIISQCVMCVILYHNVSCVSYYITLYLACHIVSLCQVCQYSTQCQLFHAGHRAHLNLCHIILCHTSYYITMCHRSRIYAYISRWSGNQTSLVRLIKTEFQSSLSTETVSSLIWDIILTRDVIVENYLYLMSLFLIKESHVYTNERSKGYKH